MPETLHATRRLFLGSALAGAAAQVAFIGNAQAQSSINSTAPSASAASLPTLGPIHQIQAGELDIGYFETGPADGPAVLLLHGFPYDIHSYVDVAPMLAARGCRVIVPHLRGYGSTRFLDSATPRSAQQSAVAADAIALMDALKIDKAVLAGYDWGARTACIVAALWPERCAGLVSVNGYLVQDIARAKIPAPAKIESGLWYQYYFATERGRAGLLANRRDIARVTWVRNSPTWKFDDATFERSAAAFDNPDYVDIVVHNYRFRLGLAPGIAKYEALERRLASLPVIGVPTITLDGDSDGVAPASDGQAYAAKFSGPRTHRIVPGVGHNLPQEAPKAFADAVWELASARG
ncbi:alpha/beta fold hydrolase [Rhodoferax sp.]|uniref:alpha/beta fold hydrolase n=1 Tax=Rhodoferax sp. TaxID=50421 RepID=UPI00374CB52A